MFLLILVVVAAAILLFARSRFASHDGAPLGQWRPRQAERSPAEIRAWVEAGLLSDDQAESIIAYEQSHRATPVRSAISPAVEGATYVGVVVFAIGAGMFVGRYWHTISVAGQLAIPAVIAVIAGVAGWRIGEGDPVTWRLRGFLWALSVVAIAATVGLFMAQVVHTSHFPTAVTTSLAVALAAALYWWRRDRPLEHLLTLAGLLTALCVAVAWAAPSIAGELVGLVLLAVGALWAIFSWRGQLPPAPTGVELGALTTLIAPVPFAVHSTTAALLLGLVVSLSWLAVGTRTSEALAILPGVIGAVVYLPWMIVSLFGSSLGAPAVAMIVGAVILIAVVWIVRRGRAGLTSRWAGSSHGASPEVAPDRHEAVDL